MGLEPTRGGWLDRAAMRREAARLLESFSHPELAPDRLVGTLPIAARQVVEILRAMAARASIVLMDEPTSSLPREDVTRLFALIRRLKASGVTIVYISHFLEEVREIADRFTVLRDGRSVAAGTLTDVTNEALIAHMVGRPVDALFPERAPEPQEDVARRRRRRGRRRRRSGAPRSGCAAARSSASPAWSARAAPRRSAR